MAIRTLSMRTLLKGKGRLHLIMITKDYLGEKHVNFVISMIIIGAIYLIFAAILIYSVFRFFKNKEDASKKKFFLITIIFLVSILIFLTVF